MTLKQYIKVLGLTTTLLAVTHCAYAQSKPPAAVNAMTVKTTNWQPSLEATGTLIAQQGITVSADVAGPITNIYFKSGQYVNKGETLVRIYPNILSAQLKAAQAQLQLSQLNFKRYQSLIKKHFVAKSQYDTVMANLKNNQAMVDEDQAKLQQTLIKAPFSGYLGIRQVNVGDYISVGQPIVNLQDTDKMYVDFSIPERYLSQIARGQNVEVSSNAYGKRYFTGKISALESKVNATTRTLLVRATIPNQDHVLVPGTFMEVKLYIGQKKSLVEIPQTAVVYSENGDYVFRVEKGKAVQTTVDLGEQNGDNVYVLSGLKAGEKIVSIGPQKLTNGSNIIVVPSQKA